MPDPAPGDIRIRRTARRLARQLRSWTPGKPRPARLDEALAEWLALDAKELQKTALRMFVWNAETGNLLGALPVR